MSYLHRKNCLFDTGYNTVEDTGFDNEKRLFDRHTEVYNVLFHT